MPLVTCTWWLSMLFTFSVIFSVVGHTYSRHCFSSPGRVNLPSQALMGCCHPWNPTFHLIHSGFFLQLRGSTSSEEQWRTILVFCFTAHLFPESSPSFAHCLQTGWRPSVQGVTFGFTPFPPRCLSPKAHPCWLQQVLTWPGLTFPCPVHLLLLFHYSPSC